MNRRERFGGDSWSGAMTPKKSRRPERPGWVGTISALVLAPVLALTFSTCGDGTVDVAEVCLDADVEPRWQGTEVVEEEILGRPEAPSRIGVYIDVSSPLGGFLPLSGRGGQETSTLRTLAQLASEYLLPRYGAGGVTIDWRGVGHELAGTKPPERLTRDDFDGEWSRLELALREIFADFQSGRAEAAALVTDLMATDEIVGPVALVPLVRDWLATEDVRSGEFHLALVGVRGDYWGMTDRLCPERGGLGCWYREREPEREQRYERLGGIEKLPLYLVLAGRGRARLEEVAESIHRDLVGLGVEAQWELLTSASAADSATMLCGAFERSDSGERNPGRYLLRPDETGFACLKDGTAQLACRLENGMKLTSAVVIPEGPPAELASDEHLEPLPGAFSAAVSGDELVLSVDCRSLREWSPLPDALPRGIHLEVAAETPTRESEVEDWESDWSSPVEVMDRTVQLSEFIKQLRLTPDGYRIVLPPLSVQEKGRFEFPFRDCPVEDPVAAGGETLQE